MWGFQFGSLFFMSTKIKANFKKGVKAMANGYIEVSKRNPCPICGTGDYCCHIPADDGFGEVYICRRFRDARVINPGGDTPSKVDGGFYLFLSETKDGTSGIYREASDVKAARDAGHKVWQKGADYSTIMGPNAVKKDLVPVGINEIADDATLDRFYRELIKLYPINKQGEEYLLKEGWPVKLVRNSMLCSFPVEDWRRNWHKNCRYLPEDTSLKRAAAVCQIIEKHGEPVGVPGFYIRTDKKNGEKYWDINTRSGVGFPLYNDKGQIVRIRVRMNFLDVEKQYEYDNEKGLYFVADDNKKRFVSWGGVKREEFDGTLVTEKDKKFRCSGKYRGLSSFDQVDNYDDGTYTNRFENGTEGYNIVGLVERDEDNKFMCILTEGEKKGYLGNYTLRAPIVIIPGVNSYNKLFDTREGKNILEHLKKEGVEVFAIAYDADKYKNTMVMGCEKGLAKRILKEGIKPAILYWDEQYGKGLDDCIVHKGPFKCKTFDNEEQIEQHYRQYGI